jgi:ABC-type uncharacterized transport system ATPase subunit
MNTTLDDTVNIVIETEQLVKRYGAVTAVDAVSLRVAQGEIYGFLGLRRPSSGVASRATSTMGRCILGSQCLT